MPNTAASWGWISTKVGRILRAPASLPVSESPWYGGGPFEVQFDYSYDGILRAYQDSLQRLGLARVHLAIVHDLDLGYRLRRADPAPTRNRKVSSA